MTTPVHDPTILRAIAHPVRNRILGELTATGSMRAADIAARLDIPANQASFHLRQLAKYGLIEEDADAARDRRDRVWRPTAQAGLMIDIRDLEAQPGGKAAAQVFLRSAAASAHRLVDLAYGYPPEGGVRAAHHSSSEDALRLTSEEAKQLRAEFEEFIEGWRTRTSGGDVDRLTYLMHTMLLPYPRHDEQPRERPDDA